MLFKVTFISFRGTLEVVNTFHVVANGVDWQASPDPTPQAVADEVATNLSFMYRAMLTDDYTLDRIDVETVPDPSNPSQVPSGGSHFVGLAGTRTSSDDDLPPRIGGLVTWRTGLIGKSFRGRSFMPPLENKSEIVADLITGGGAYSNAVGTFMNTVVDGSLAAGSSWTTAWVDTWNGYFVVYSPTRHKRSESPHEARITGASYTRKLAYLSSRDS